MENALKDKCVEYGHSTPAMAAELAVRAGCKVLCLTHVSPRYKPIPKEEEKASTSSPTAQILLDEAADHVKENESDCEVVIAEDFFVLQV